MLKSFAKTTVAALLLLLAVLLLNTWRLPAPPEPGTTRMPPPADLAAAAERLAEAVRIPTIAQGFATADDGARFRALHALLERRFPRSHATLKRERIGASLLYTWPGSDASLAPILLTAHQDVVPVEPGTEGRWTHPPFGGVIADGYIWGRGTLDNKQMLMATLEGVERLLAEGYRPKRSVLLAFGHDEEIGGFQGARVVADALAQRQIRALWSLDEGSGILDGLVPGASRPIAQIGVAEKGYLTLQLKAVAPGGHASMPPPSTAVGKLGRAIARLESEQMPATLAGPGGAALRAMAPALPFARRLVLANTWLFGPLLTRELAKTASTNALIRTTTAPTVITGGVKDNVLPSEASALVNFRLAPGDSIEAVKAHVARVIADADVSITEHPMPSSTATPVADTGNPGYALLAALIGRIEPNALVVPGLVLAGTDSKHWSRVSEAALRFAPMRLGPDEIRRIHATDERIAIANYGELISFYLALLREGTQ